MYVYYLYTYVCVYIYRLHVYVCMCMHTYILLIDAWIWCVYIGTRCVYTYIYICYFIQYVCIYITYIYILSVHISDTRLPGFFAQIAPDRIGLTVKMSFRGKGSTGSHYLPRSEARND